MWFILDPVDTSLPLYKRAYTVGQWYAPHAVSSAAHESREDAEHGLAMMNADGDRDWAKRSRVVSFEELPEDLRIRYMAGKVA